MISVIQPTLSVETKLTALITVPDDFDRQKERLPLIVFLHGVGERGDDPELLKRYGLAKCFSRDPMYHGVRAITLSPQCPNGRVWNHLVREVFSLIEDTVKEYNADPERVSITGMSMGGCGTWDMICTYPEYFSAAAPVCGAGFIFRAPYRSSLVIRAYHGDRDGIVPYHCSVEMVEAVNARGGDATLITCEGWGHNSWDYAYEMSDLVEWLVAQKRK